MRIPTPPDLNSTTERFRRTASRYGPTDARVTAGDRAWLGVGVALYLGTLVWLVYTFFG